jgi:hypothetical protein
LFFCFLCFDQSKTALHTLQPRVDAVDPHRHIRHLDLQASNPLGDLEQPIRVIVEHLTNAAKVLKNDVAGSTMKIVPYSAATGASWNCA